MPPLTTRTSDASIVVIAETEALATLSALLTDRYRVAVLNADGLDAAAALAPKLFLISGPRAAELVSGIRSRHELDVVPILLIVDPPEHGVGIRLLRAGAQDLVTVPFATEELYARIDNLLVVGQQAEVGAHLAAFIDAAPDGIFIANREGHYTEVNRTACSMLGFERAELVGSAMADRVPPDDLERMLAAKRQLLAGGGMVTAEWRLRKRDGTYLPVELSGTLLPDGHLAGFVRDISRRRQYETTIRQYEATAWQIMTISADAIISMDADHRITMFNDGAERIFGYARAEVIGAPIEQLMPERFRASHRGHVERFAAGNVAARRMGRPGTPIVGLRKNGAEFPCDANISRLEIDGTQILTVALRDTSDAVRVEREQRLLADAGAALASSLDYEHTLTTVAHLAVRDLADYCIVDLVQTGGEIRRLKVAARDPAHASICEQLERVELDRARPFVRHSAHEVWRTTVVEHVTTASLRWLTQSEDHLRALEATAPRSLIAVPLVVHATVLGTIVLLSSTSTYGQADVRLAKELAHRATLAIENARLYDVSQRATAARDEILGIVAHDLRNPLHAIGILAERLRDRGDELARRPAERILHNADRMSRLIRDLLDVTTIEAGQLAVEPARVATAELVIDATSMQRPLASSSDLELRLELAPELPEIWADRDRLLQIFENLITNAAKFTPRGGRVTIGAAPREGGVVFWVADTGRGIAPEDHARLFERFWRARRAERGGAGLGLPIVKGLVEAHRGRVWVDSAPGRGSTFYFTIPAAPTLDHPASAPPP